MWVDTEKKEYRLLVNHHLVTSSFKDIDQVYFYNVQKKREKGCPSDRKVNLTEHKMDIDKQCDPPLAKLQAETLLFFAHKNNQNFHSSINNNRTT